ncbi:MAG TPA: ribosome maturation factor [Ruminococcaceae bacterium]|nr:ribosome maturation factor [Oscillospiraceae bacterium]
MAGKGKGGNTVAAVTALAQPIAEQLGLRLWDVRFVKEGADWFLRVFIDKDGGVGIDDCVAMSHALDKPLDEADPIEQSYCLEVSSPGTDRELTRAAHFEACLGSPINVRMIRPLEDGRRELNGILESHDKDGFVVDLGEDGKLLLNRKEVSWVRLDDSDC